MKVKVGYMKGRDGIFKEKNNNKQKKTRNIDKESHDQIHIQTRTGSESRTASTLRNGRGLQQKVATDSIQATVSGFEPRTYRSEQSNFNLPLGLEPKNTLEQTTSSNESSPEANTRCH